MHLSFHLDQHITEEEARRVANAVLAFGGVSPTKSVSELTLDLSIDTSAATEALDKLAAHPGAQFVDEGAVRVHSPENVLAQGVVAGRECSVSLPNCEIPPDPSQVHSISIDNVKVYDTLDKNGVPWDERIHSSSRNKNADGTWRMKRGVAAGFVAEVEQELRALSDVQAPPAPIEVTTLDDSRPRYADGGAIPPPPPVPPAPAVPTAYTYANVVNLIASKKMQPEVYVAVIGESLPDFAKTCASNPAAAAEAYEKLSNL